MDSNPKMISRSVILTLFTKTNKVSNVICGNEIIHSNSMVVCSYAWAPIPAGHSIPLKSSQVLNESTAITKAALEGALSHSSAFLELQKRYFILLQ